MITPTATESFSEWFARQGFRYFKADELTWYFGRVRNGIRNSEPPRALWPNIVPTIRVLDDLRAHFGKPLTISSTYRALPYNRAIGSPDGSLHVQFKAADFSVSGVSPRQVAEVLDSWRRAGKIVGGVGTYRTFTHYDCRSRNATW
jgi:uncharacterized protein YcbK (DUF882 family)